MEFGEKPTRASEESPRPASTAPHLSVQVTRPLGPQPKNDSDVVFQDLSDQSGVVLLPEVTDLVRRKAHFFKIRQQLLPDRLTLLSFAKIQFRQLLHRLLQGNSIAVAIIILNYLFLILRALRF